MHITPANFNGLPLGFALADVNKNQANTKKQTGQSLMHVSEVIFLG